MNSRMLSQNSNGSTYCSEAEQREIGANYRTENSSSTVALPKRQMNSHQKNDSTRYFQPKVCSFISAREKSSPPLLSTVGIMESEKYFPLSQNKHGAQFINSTKRLPLDSQFSHNKRFGSTQSTSQFIKKESTASYVDIKLKSLGDCKPKFQNKIFETEDKFTRYPQNNHTQYPNRDIDTISITSEDISNIVDKQIALHRKRREERIQSRSQSSNPIWQRMHSFERSSRICERNSCRNHNKHYRTSFSQTEHMPPIVGALNMDISSKPKKYKLTDNHIIEIANFFNIKRHKLKLAIENVTSGIAIGTDISDDEVIKTSQSPIRRRYSNSQLTGRSNISK